MTGRWLPCCLTMLLAFACVPAMAQGHKAVTMHWDERIYEVEVVASADNQRQTRVFLYSPEQLDAAIAHTWYFDESELEAQKRRLDLSVIEGPQGYCRTSLPGKLRQALSTMQTLVRTDPARPWNVGVKEAAVLNLVLRASFLVSACDGDLRVQRDTARQGKEIIASAYAFLLQTPGFSFQAPPSGMWSIP